MKSIYKTALLVGYKQPFVDWYNQTIDKNNSQKRMKLSDVNEKKIVFLMELFDSEEKLQLRLLKIKSELFFFIMNEWCNDESYWHHDISELEFEKFFEISRTNSIFDFEEKIDSFSLSFGLQESLNKFKKRK